MSVLSYGSLVERFFFRFDRERQGEKERDIFFRNEKEERKKMLKKKNRRRRKKEKKKEGEKERESVSEK